MEKTLIIIPSLCMVVRTYRDIKVKEIDKERQIALKSSEMMSGNGHKDKENYCKQTFAQASIQGFKQSNDKNALPKIWDVFISYPYDDASKDIMLNLKSCFDNEGVNCFPDNLSTEQSCGYDIVKKQMYKTSNFVIIFTEESLNKIEDYDTYPEEIKKISKYMTNRHDSRRCYIAIADGLSVKKTLNTIISNSSMLHEILAKIFNLNEEPSCKDKKLVDALRIIRDKIVRVFGYKDFPVLARVIKNNCN